MLSLILIHVDTVPKRADGEQLNKDTLDETEDSNAALFSTNTAPEIPQFELISPIRHGSQSRGTESLSQTSNGMHILSGIWTTVDTSIYSFFIVYNFMLYLKITEVVPRRRIARYTTGP